MAERAYGAIVEKTEILNDARLDHFAELALETPQFVKKNLTPLSREKSKPERTGKSKHPPP
jgi:hypothetical protein